MRVLHFTALSVALAGSACNQSGLSTSLVPMSIQDGGGAPAGGDDALLTATDDAGDNGRPSNVYPAAFPAPPQVVTGGGPRLSAPRFVPVFFSNDDPQVTAQITDFLAQVGATKYWEATTHEYGVGPGTSAPPVQLSEKSTGTFDDNAIQAWLGAKLNGNDAMFPANDYNTVYALHYPAGVTITLAGRGGNNKSCQSFGGYHSNFRLDKNHKGALVAYAVIPRCADFGGLGGIDAVTATESHELVEAATDPYPQNLGAYGQVDDDHLYWEFILGGGETGDMCAQDPRSFTRFPELPYTVQRSWSNQAALAGTDPCVPPLPNQPYFNTVPELNDQVPGRGGVVSLGVQIPVGQSQTIPLDLFSDSDTHGAWTVKVRDTASLFGGGQPTLSFSLDRNTGRNGERLHLTIKTLQAGRNGTGSFVILSTLNGHTNYWFGLVGEQ